MDETDIPAVVSGSHKPVKYRYVWLNLKPLTSYIEETSTTSGMSALLYSNTNWNFVFCLRRLFATEGIVFSGCPCVLPSVRDHTKVCKY